MIATLGSRLARAPYAWVVCLALLLGLCLRLQSLQNGFFSDDFIEASILDGSFPSARAPLDLFNFGSGGDDNRRLMHFGLLPWWTPPTFQVAMMRPLSSVLVLVDRYWLGDNPVACHVHSMLWWVLLMLVVAALLRELFPQPMASLALLFFAVEEGHALPVGWLANRNALMALSFAFYGFLLHVRARRADHDATRGVLVRLWGSGLCFTIALLCGEWSFPVLGYVVAYEALERDDAVETRLLALVPSALPALLFLIVRGALGYGARSSGVYIDPVTESSAFLIAAVQRIPVFFGDLVFSIPAGWWSSRPWWREVILSWDVISPQVWLRFPSWRFFHVGLGLIALGVCLALYRVAARSSERDPKTARTLRSLLVGACLGLVPMVASFPSSRLVLAADLAIASIAATLVLAGAENARTFWSRDRRRSLGWLTLMAAVLYFQAYEAARTSYEDASIQKQVFESARQWALRAELDDRKLPQQHVILLGSIEHTTLAYAPFMRAFYGHPMPLSFWTLSGTSHAHDMYRPTANSIELTPLGGSWLGNELEKMYRAERFRFREGETVDVGGMRATITRVVAGEAQTVRFTFDKSIDDPSYVFLYSSVEGLVRARLPEIGERVRYRRAAFPNAKLMHTLRDLREPSSQCPRERPQLDDCRVGFAFADCGGSGEPVFACNGEGACRWFLHGCVAETFTASSCSARNVCCDHAWPFAHDEPGATPRFVRVLHQDLWAWGTTPGDPERELTLSVDVDPQLPSLPAAVRCSALPDATQGPCNRMLQDVQLGSREAFGLRVAWAGSGSGRDFGVTAEVIDGRDGVLRARVCRIPDPWLVPGEERARCEARSTTPICADTGHVTVSRFPVESALAPTLALRLSAHFPDGAEIEAEL